MTSPITNQNNVAVSATPTLIGTMSAGSLILNNSATDAVFVSPYSNLSSATGLRIGPLGSVTWSQTSPLWAVSESGNPVSITISSAATNPSDPLTVAEALITQGVPSTALINTLPPIFDDTGAGFTLTNDMLAGSSSLILSPGAGNLSVIFEITWFINNTLSARQVYNLTEIFTLEIPIIGTSCVMKDYVGNVLSLVGVASNRSIPNTIGRYDDDNLGLTGYTPLRLINLTATSAALGSPVGGHCSMLIRVTYPTSTPNPWRIGIENASGVGDLFYVMDSSIQKLYDGTTYSAQANLILPATSQLHFFSTASAGNTLQVEGLVTTLV